TAGVLRLARAPFAPVVAGVTVLLWLWGGPRRGRAVVLFVVGAAAALAPWALRNYWVTGEFIPFTTEGGKILFQGTYLPGDDVGMSELRRDAGFAALEAAEPADPVEQYRYWRRLAARQGKADPAGQGEPLLRKAARVRPY